MSHRFKYLTHNPEDKGWGVFLTVVGTARVEPDSEYPPSGHPTGYHFKWTSGRVLQEYQINYITSGEGIIETREGAYKVSEGSIILLKPGMWHRYRPLKRTGWTEHYIGFMGDVADIMIRSTPLLNDNPSIMIGFQEDLIRLFQEITNEVESEKPGYHQVCSGAVIHILGKIISIRKNVGFKNTAIDKTIQKACLIIRDNCNVNLNIEQLANDLNINYSLFRKAFKKYTGLSPMQYHTSLRLKQANFLLTNTDLSIKEISYRLGFCSVFYFSKLFNEKTGMSPGNYRKISHPEK